MNNSSHITHAWQAFEQLRNQELIDEKIHFPQLFFMPVITYPAMSKMPEATASQLLSQAPAVQNPVAVYIHIPFCITRCLFCHWVIKLNSKEDEVAHYLHCLDLELERYRKKLGIENQIQASSVLVGGGTPTILSPTHMKMFFEIIHKHINMDHVLQFSYEGEPSTLLGPTGAERLTLMKDYGVNRVSYGVQAFDDRLLRQNGRQHSSAQALESITRTHDFGIPSVSIDLIYGLTGQSVEDWIQTMLTAIQSGADAWQLYRLRIQPHGDRPGNVLHHAKRKPGLYSQVEDTLIMKMIGIQISEENGFPQRYTRIFARQPHDISFYLHDVNSKLRDVISVGISSWGNIGNTYLLNVGNDFKKYYQLIADGGLAVDRGMNRDSENEARHCFILQLKNTQVDKELFRQRMGCYPQSIFGTTIRKMMRLHLIEEDEKYYRLTFRGRFYADQVAAQFTSTPYFPATPQRPNHLGQSSANG